MRRPKTLALPLCSFCHLILSTPDTHTHRCDPAVIAQVLLAASPPTLDCLLGTVLPGLVTKISSLSAAAKAPTSSETGTKDSSASGRNGGEQAATSAGNGQRNTAALLAICRLAASVAASVRGDADPVAFRDKVSGSELRKLGALGKEAEVALAEAFFYGGGGSGVLEPPLKVASLDGCCCDFHGP